MCTIQRGSHLPTVGAGARGTGPAAAARHGGVAAARRNEPAELDQIDAAFAVFDFGDPAVRHLQPGRELALRSPAFFRARHSSERRAEYSGVWIDFSIDPIMGAS